MKSIKTWQQAVKAGAGKKKPATRQKYAELAVELFNASVRSGEPCHYWPGVRHGDGRKGTVQSPAWVINEYPVVRVHEYTGAISLTHVEVDEVAG